MKILTQDFFNGVIDSALLEYTKEWYFSDDEAKSLKKNILLALVEKIEDEEAGDQNITVVFNTI